MSELVVLNNTLGTPINLEHLTSEQLAALPALMKQVGIDLPSGNHSGDAFDIDEAIGPQRPNIPSLKIRQRMTVDNSCPSEVALGDFYITSGDIAPAPLRAVPLMMWIEHTRWSGGDNSIECKSPDGRLGIIGIKCHDCPEKPWRDGQRTQCNRSINGFFLTRDMRLVTIRFSGSSYRTGTKIGASVKYRPTPWDKFVLLDTEKKRTTRGEFFVYSYKTTSESPNDSLKEISENLSNEMAKNRKEFLGEFYERYEPKKVASNKVTEVALDDDPSFDEDL